MRHPFTAVFTFAAVLSVSIVCAQTDNRLFRTDSTYISKVKVTENNIDKPLAWSGGLNFPKFAMTDLNKDGKNDLVIFESPELYLPNPQIVSNSIKTFINSGTPGNPQFRYAPEYEYLVPYPYRIMKMLDYNCDQIPDFFYGDTFLGVCDGYYNSNGNWACKNCRIIYNSGTNPAPLPFSSTDVPGIADIDNDGDLDFVSMNMTYKFDYYKDMRSEESLPCDTLKFKFKDRCWGKVFHQEKREFLLGVSCDNTGLKISGDRAKVTDGSASLCLFDADGDGDFDALIGESKYPDIQFLKNGKVEHGYPVDTMIAQDTTWQSGGHKLHMASHPMAYWLNIDDDLDNDIVISPGRGENYRSVAYYRNLGSTAAPSYVYQSDSFLIEDMIDAGSNSYPYLYDYNKDGKTDLFIGGMIYQPGGFYKTSLLYLENTSTGNDLSFNLVTRNFLNISSYAETGAAIAIGDLDGDGLDDLVAGRENGTIICFKNQAASANVPPDWQLWQTKLKDADNNVIELAKYTTPFIYDIDQDNKKDLIVGNSTGQLTYYKNVGNSQIALKHQTNALGGVDVMPDLEMGFSAPYIGPIDNSGKHYLMVGSGSGAIYRYSGFENGNVTIPYKLEDTLYSDIRIPGQYSSVAFGNLSGDSKYELFIGNVKGGVFAYRQIWDVNVDEVSNVPGKLQIYPNPAKDKVRIVATADLGKSATVLLVDQMGRIVTAPFAVSGKTVDISVTMLPAGIYVCRVNTGKEEFKGVFVKE